MQGAFTAQAAFDFEAFAQAVAVQVRFLDNVLDVTYWPLVEQQQEASKKRRIGIGYTGLGDALIMLGLRYDSQPARDMAAKITQRMMVAAYLASADLAEEKGAFPLFDAERYLEAGTFASRLPPPVQAAIRAKGMRNSHLLAIAPTGTVSLAFADNASNGVEPAFTLAYTRKKRLKDGGHTHYAVKDHAFRVFSETVCDPALREGLIDAVVHFQPTFVVDGVTYTVKDVLPEAFVCALEMKATDHLAMVQAVQPYIDTSISKTVNVAADYPYDDFKGLYLQAWTAGLKGLATYRPNAVLGAVLSLEAPGSAAVAGSAATPDDDPLRKPFDSRPEGELEGVTAKVPYQTYEGNKSVYVVVNFVRVHGVVNGQPVTIERPVEFFMPSSQSGDGQQWISSNMRQLSLVARSGASVAKALANMREVTWDKGPVRSGWVTKADGTRVPRFHDSEVAAIGYALQGILAKRGFLDELGHPIPTPELSRRLAQRDAVASREAERNGALPHGEDTTAAVPTMATPLAVPGVGKKCAECGAHEVHKVDGCERCVNCGALGSCG